jgi:hypothetical protein
MRALATRRVAGERSPAGEEAPLGSQVEGGGQVLGSLRHQDVQALASAAPRASLETELALHHAVPPAK